MAKTAPASPRSGSSKTTGKVALPDLTATGYRFGADRVPDPMRDVNYFRLDPSMRLRLRLYLEAKEAAWAEMLLDEFGALCGGRMAELAQTANKNGPVLQQYDASGRRIDAIVFHPSYTEMCRLAYGFGLSQMNHLTDFRGLGRAPSRLVQAMAGTLFATAEQGLYCPVFMTNCLIGALRQHADETVKAKFLPKLLNLDPDHYYQGAILMTEKFGGSDVGATETKAVQVDGHWRLYGDKWFCSNANADLYSTLARYDDQIAGTKGLGMFVVPKILDDGSRNAVRMNRIKDKLGTRSMASGEMTFDGALAYPVGPLEQGFKILCGMLNTSRLGTATMATGAMRRGLLEALNFARERETFGKTLHRHGMVKRAIADIYAEVEGAGALLAYAYSRLDRSNQQPDSETLAGELRMITTLAKFNNSAKGVEVAAECVQVLGGVGYIEDRETARIYRDALVHPIWEGTTNMLALDVLRAIQKENADAALVSGMEAMEAILSRNETRSLFTPLRAEMEATLATLRESLGAEQVSREYYAYERVWDLAASVIGLVLVHEAEARLVGDGDPGGLDTAKAYLWKRKPAFMTRLYGEEDRFATAKEIVAKLFS
ncbi:MAG: acyl-CoA dehydrogenase family protein [Alphaproteobacteria bacterium]|nr:acyl-CoA dehydrogenase family protein [Alphaproteobacteria bacterium]